ncbi:Protein of unknown function [Bacillus cytotoxicus]|uniref:Uncharacterized protein n=1 Tax=Bacillus cytotoxicus TaxID=580165 RepID=A0AAX2CHD0_9BACI|nr:Protein of unknown function [Bacillus cytotoxicus]SCN37305.1 Protein of unknown function [Bacillus cytotoxicus]
MGYHYLWIASKSEKTKMHV